ncbi:MAG: ATP-binding protein [Prevotellaceae bacterium]|jgi:anti-sigma regulatory factor (Ser/Thr protein kinase)|nr:ATP-binding protein [Prevotellaceae bacterium]
MITFTFNSISRVQWLPEILRGQAIETCAPDKTVQLVFQNIHINDFEPFHFVLLACLIDKLKKQGYMFVKIDDENHFIYPFLIKTLKIEEYFGAHPKNYVVSSIENIFNLWRVNDAEKDMVSIMVGDYLKQNFFKNKDLTAVKESLVEIFYNIFDHAGANGNAFSFIQYNQEKEKLYVAVCDFGIGIAKSIRNYFPEIDNDGDAIAKAIEDNITVKSQPHNMGMGLGNIISAISENDSLRIFSNQGMLYVTGGRKRTFLYNYNFAGTLIYYEMSLSHFPELEINSTFEL